MGEGNQVKWVGVRPTDPPENIPVEVGLPYTSSIIYKNSAANSTTIIYTVPSGKKLYVTGAVFILEGTNNDSGNLMIYRSGGVAICALGEGKITIYYSTVVQASIQSPIILPAAYSIRVSAFGATSWARGSFTGYLK